MNSMNTKIGKYIELTKPKVTLLNLLVGATCFVLAALPALDWARLMLFLAAGYLTAGGCGVLNSVYDLDLDRIMLRTSKRAIPAGYVTSKNAFIFGTALTAIGLGVAHFLLNAYTTLMMLLGIIFYLGVYTVWLKRTSPWNVVIGGAAGCFAGLAGWTAAVNALSLMPLLVSLVDFLWTPGHLWGLAIKKVKEYKKAGVPMLPATYGLKRAAQVTFLFNAATIGSTLLLSFLGLSGVLFAAVAIPAGAWLILESGTLLSLPCESRGFRVFAVSMPYLAIIMAALILDKIIAAS